MGKTVYKAPPPQWLEVKLTIEKLDGTKEVKPLLMGKGQPIDLEGVKSITVDEYSFAKDFSLDRVIQSGKRRIGLFTKVLGKMVGFSPGKKNGMTVIAPKDGATEKMALVKLQPAGKPGSGCEVKFEFLAAQFDQEPTVAFSPDETLTGVTRELKTVVQMPEETLADPATTEMKTAQFEAWAAEHPDLVREESVQIGSEPTEYVPPLIRRSLTAVEKGAVGDVVSAKPRHLEVVSEPDTTLRKVPGLPRMTFGRFSATTAGYFLLGMAGLGVEKAYEHTVGEKATWWGKLVASNSPIAVIGSVLLLKEFLSAYMTHRSIAAAMRVVLANAGKAAIPKGVSFVSGLAAFIPISIGVSASESMLGIDPDSLGGKIGGLAVSSALAAATRFTARGVVSAGGQGLLLGATLALTVYDTHYVIDPFIGKYINKDGDGTVTGLIADDIYNKNPWVLALAVWPNGLPIGPAAYIAHGIYEQQREDEIKENTSPMNNE